MDRASWAVLVTDAGLFALFAGIVCWVYRARNRDRGEAPKYRMLEDRDP
ncbi:MAG: cbb3-type cytochrome c oxidase subunit 3 [Candidatus Dadabacteria bacterium]|nr:MAG: cbb3-type cytochrome c oxidase subunit 3 [Candidatus Dadabacteria bacterium]